MDTLSNGDIYSSSERECIYGDHEGTVSWQSINGTVKFLGDGFDLVRGGQHFVEVNRKEGTCYWEVETISGNAIFAARIEIAANEVPIIYPVH